MHLTYNRDGKSGYPLDIRFSIYLLVVRFLFITPRYNRNNRLKCKAENLK